MAQRLALAALPEAEVLQAMNDASTFCRGRAGAGFTEEATPAPGLTPEEFVELLVRCAQLKYANVPHMTMCDKLMAFLSILLDGESADPGSRCFETNDADAPELGGGHELVERSIQARFGLALLTAERSD